MFNRTHSDADFLSGAGGIRDEAGTSVCKQTVRP